MILTDFENFLLDQMDEYSVPELMSIFNTSSKGTIYTWLDGGNVILNQNVIQGLDALGYEFKLVKTHPRKIQHKPKGEAFKAYARRRRERYDSY